MCGRGLGRCWHVGQLCCRALGKWAWWRGRQKPHVAQYPSTQAQCVVWKWRRACDVLRTVPPAYRPRWCSLTPSLPPLLAQEHLFNMPYQLASFDFLADADTAQDAETFAVRRGGGGWEGGGYGMGGSLGGWLRRRVHHCGL